MNILRKFRKWARETAKRRGLICHFYIPESNNQYYDKSDYAYFNLFSGSCDWVVKGTPGHGVTSRRGKRSPATCLNCFEIDAKKHFYSAIKELYKARNDKFEFGIIFNKRKIKSIFKEVSDVEPRFSGYNIPLSECWKYDNPRFKQPLAPFNYCQVVRIKIPASNLNELPMVAMPGKTIMGLLVRKGEYGVVKKLVKRKEMEMKVFPIL